MFASKAIEKYIPRPGEDPRRCDQWPYCAEGGWCECAEERRGIEDDRLDQKGKAK